MEYGRRCRRVAAAKRIADIGIASVGIAVLVVLFIPVCCAIRVSSSGPVIFRQTRVGVNRRSRQSATLHGARRSVDIGGRPFVMYKFRSMRNTRDATAMLSFPGDQRITGVGAVLRRTHIDELPQFWNVLKGDMSLVGPRPIVPEEARMYGEELQAYLRSRPGLTGAWQVSGRSDQSYARRVWMDRQYVEHWSLWRDVVIIVKTVPVLLTTRGSY
jgi:exopolysaccharide production protein ExoY